MSRRPKGDAFLRKLKGKKPKPFITKAEKLQQAISEQASQMRKEELARRYEERRNTMSDDEKAREDARIAKLIQDAYNQTLASRVITKEQLEVEAKSILVNNAIDSDSWLFQKS